MWNRRVSSRLCVVSALLPVSLLLLGCHHQHSSASNKAMPRGTDSIALVNGLPVQQSEGYQAAVRQFTHHQYPAALASIDSLLKQPQYRQKTADRAFLLHQQAICRHAIDPRIPASVPVPASPPALHLASQLASQADCGPRVLLMLCPQLGVRTTLDTLRRQAGTTAAGTTMKGLARAAKSVGLKAQGINMDKQALKQLSDPAIAWYDGNHYVALLSIDGEQATIHDPNKPNEEVLPINELLGRSGGFLLTLSR